MKISILLISLFIIYHVNFSFTHPKKYYSQFEQDKYINEKIFKNKKNGIFFEIGAYDGILSSNSYYFEKNLDWKGVCVEPIENLFNRLKRNRKCICINGCIWNKIGPAKFYKFSHPGGFIFGECGLIDSYDSRQLQKMYERCKNEKNCILTTLEVHCYKFNDICLQNSISHIDYLSIDTEGSELLILKSIDFNNIEIAVISVENNYNEPAIQNFLKTKGYKFINRLGVDDIYKKNK